MKLTDYEAFKEILLHSHTDFEEVYYGSGHRRVYVKGKLGQLCEMYEFDENERCCDTAHESDPIGMADGE